MTLEALSEDHLPLKGISGAYVKRCIEGVSPRWCFYRFRFSCFCVVLHLLLCICYIGVGRCGCICNSEYLWMGFDMGFSFLNGVAYEETLKILLSTMHCFMFLLK